MNCDQKHNCLLAWQERGKHFLQLRLCLNLSQKYIADQIGVSVGVVRRFEQGLFVKRRHLVDKALYNFLSLTKMQKSHSLITLEI